MKDHMSPVSVLFFAFKVAVVFVVFWNHFQVKGFTASTTSTTRHRQQRTDSPFLLAAAGRGMGMGSATAVPKKKGGKKNKKSKSTASSSAASPFNVNSSLIRMEKKYDELMLNAAKELQKEEESSDRYLNSVFHAPMMTSEYVIAARSASNKRSIPDWVPIAQLCLTRPESEYEEGAADAMVQHAISAYCRELSHVAAIGAPVFSTIARNELQYSVESVESFHKHVYDEVVEGNANKNQDETMTKAEARQTLGLDAASLEKSDIKQTYRKLSFELHPDRFEGTPEECEDAKQQFSKVKLAYETLSSGVRGEDGVSWYESLGGRARTGFVGPVNLLPLAAAQEHMQRHEAEGAIVGLEPPLVQSFVARHLRSE